MTPTTVPIRLAELSDEMIRESDLIHVMSPLDMGFQAWLPIRPAAGWGGPASRDGGPIVIRIVVEREQTGQLLAELRARIWAVVNDSPALG
jgi:hypothetical protein